MDEYYAITQLNVEKLRDLKTLLYNMKRIDSDTMRDYAHIIGLIIEEAENIGPIKEEG